LLITWVVKKNPQNYVKMQVVDIPIRQSISQSGLYDSARPAPLVAVVEEAVPVAAKAKAPRAPRAPKAKAEKAPVPPAAPPAPVAAAAAPKKAAKAVKAAPAAPGPETSPAVKAKMVKGSEEAKAHMAKLREAAKAKKAAIAAASKTPEGGSDADDFGGEPAKKTKVVRKKAKAIALEMEA
jgi:type IV secretory pathway VirB10-like protein